MDHAEVREILELAATEPGGLNELLAGAPAGSQSVQAHVAGCPACRAELDELHRSAATIREVIRTTPAPDLRERTLSLLATAGRARSAEGIEAPAGLRRRFSLMSWVPALSLGAVAAAAIAGILMWRAVDVRLTAADAQIAQQRSAIAGLTVVTDWTMRLGAAPDAALVRLASANDGYAAGTVLFSAVRGELVMVATGLPAPPPGYEYRCWIDQGSGPVRIGKMYHTGEVAYWGGEVERLHGVDGELTFGVTLVDLSREDVPGRMVLTGAI
jgi:hypothetical protein